MQNSSSCSGQYNIYPGFSLEYSVIAAGYVALAERIAHHPIVIVDGYGGVNWQACRDFLNQALIERGVRATWIDVQSALQPKAEIDRLVSPFLGGDDPVFGTRFTGTLADFYDRQKLTSLQPDPAADVNILYGPGAVLAEWTGYLVYIDVPKYEIQLRSRVGKITNLGARSPASPKVMYKRFYFVDWIALNHHKAEILPRIDLFIDAQATEEPVMISGADLRGAIQQMSRNYFRVRPWFEPGPWGGQWMRAHISQLPKEKPNYAWSFELIVPENGIMLEGDGYLLEFSFDLLMFQEFRAVLGKGADRFGYEFPIRFDFLDTFDGGNLSLQCHPRPVYISENFGESFTQDECYYILDCKPGAQVYLGFRDDIVPQVFRSDLEHSSDNAIPVDVERYVNTELAHKHDLFLIPNGTIHCSGVNNMVLEISSMPYIYTFKMYDWLRLDLDGQPRPLNIQRAFDNLYFDRKGERIRKEFVSHPQLIERGESWELYHLPTHPEHFYDVFRIRFSGSVTLPTNDSCQVMSLVEGETVTLITQNGLRKCFNYAETFVVPAAAKHFTLINDRQEPAIVVIAFLKDPSSV
jgi:mannose-6-phosphate isomerase class I